MRQFTEKDLRDLKQRVVPGKNLASVFNRLNIRKPLSKNPRFSNDGWTDKGWRLLDCIPADITPDEALEIYQNHRNPNNRNLNVIHVNNLAREIQLGVNIAIVYIGNIPFPMIDNGHHSLIGIYGSGRIIRVSFCLFEAVDEAAASALYAIFDDNFRRSRNQVIKASTFAYTVPQSWVVKVTTAIRLATSDFHAAQKSKGNMDFLKISQTDETLAFAQLLHEISLKYGVTITSRLLPTAIVAALYCMWLAEPDYAVEFMDTYISGQNLALDNPMFVLREMVSDRKEGSHASNLIQRHASWAHMAWVAYLTDKTGNTQNFRRAFTRGYTIPQFDDWSPWKKDKIEAA